MSVNTHHKGSRWRLAVEQWLRGAGFSTTTRGIGYSGDDIVARIGVHAFSVEAKNHARIELSTFVDQAVAQCHADDELALPVVVIHRRGKANPDEAYVVLPGWAFIELTTR